MVAPRRNVILQRGGDRDAATGVLRGTGREPERRERLRLDCAARACPRRGIPKLGVEDRAEPVEDRAEPVELGRVRRGLGVLAQGEGHVDPGLQRQQEVRAGRRRAGSLGYFRARGLHRRPVAAGRKGREGRTVADRDPDEARHQEPHVRPVQPRGRRSSGGVSWQSAGTRQSKRRQRRRRLHGIARRTARLVQICPGAASEAACRAIFANLAVVVDGRRQSQLEPSRTKV